MSSLIKSGFVAFSQENMLVIDANKSKIIKGIEEAVAAREATAEEALAEEMILDAGLGDEVLSTVEGLDIANLSEKSLESLRRTADDIVKAAKKEAESIINMANEEAEELRIAANEEAAQVKQQAQEEGYEQGYSAGMDAAKDDIEEKKAAFKQHIRELEISLGKKVDAIVEELEHNMVDWLCQMIPQITGVVIDGQRDVLLYIINAAIRELDNSKHFVIRVSSDDYEELEESKEEIYGALNPNIDLEVFEDAKLSSMQCVIETDNGIVDVSLDVQLDNLIKALRLMVKE